MRPELTGWQINIMTEAAAAQKRDEEVAKIRADFMDSLDIDEAAADVLIGEGFSSVEEIAYVPGEGSSTRSGLDRETVDEAASAPANKLPRRRHHP